MVGAEESLRIETGDKPVDTAKKKNSSVPSAVNATGIHSINLSQNVYGKPGALILG
jgi:hypothetical protein